MTPPLDSLLTALAREQAALNELLTELPSSAWVRASSATGWSIRDQVAHLADTEEVARDTIVNGPRTYRRVISQYLSPGEFIEEGCRRADSMSPGRLLEWWSRAAGRTLDAFHEASSSIRVPWGFGMSLVDFARARLMEHWAHGLDIREGLDAPVPMDVSSMEEVAVLGLRTTSYALFRAKIRPPTDHTLRLQLEAPGKVFRAGPHDATDVIYGDLYSWCRIVVRRGADVHRQNVHPEGPLALLAVYHARAYL